jgi:multicomponent K+:H+ antiporter subunit D
LATVGSVGTILIALGVFTPRSTAAALYYMIHSTLACALLFLVVDLVRSRRPDHDDRLVPAPAIMQGGLVSSLFLASAVGMAGLPPLSGFIGKLLILSGVRGTEPGWTVWAIILVTSLVLVVGFARAGSILFWQASGETKSEPADTSGLRLTFVAAFGLLGSMVALTLLARPVLAFLTDTAAQVYDPAAYISAVLPQLGETQQ